MKIKQFLKINKSKIKTQFLFYFPSFLSPPLISLDLPSSSFIVLLALTSPAMPLPAIDLPTGR